VDTYEIHDLEQLMSLSADHAELCKDNSVSSGSHDEMCRQACEIGR